MKTMHVGISGWRYAPWRGVFYPPGLPQAQELYYASRALPCIELNGSFYGRIKAPTTMRRSTHGQHGSGPGIRAANPPMRHGLRQTDAPPIESATCSASSITTSRCARHSMRGG